MSQITTHILDTSRGLPAAGVKVQLLQQEDGRWILMTVGETNNDGRIGQWADQSEVSAGQYKLVFDTAGYFSKCDVETFYPSVEILFLVTSDNQHYHVPLLLNPFGYSTYRGS